MKNRNKIVSLVKSFVLLGGKAVVLAVFLFYVQTPASAAINLTGQENAIVERTNQVRAEVGLAPLELDSRLMNSAFDKAWDMAARSYFNHGSPEGWRMGYWIGRAGYSYLLAGENLAKGFTSIDRLMQAWIASPLHYKNLVEPKFEHLGIGIAHGLYHGKGIVFVVQHFGVEYEPVVDSVAQVSSGGDKTEMPVEVFVEGEQIDQGSPDIPTSPLGVVFVAPEDVDNVTVAAMNGKPDSTNSDVGDVIILLAVIALAGIGYLAERWSSEQAFIGTDSTK